MIIKGNSFTVMYETRTYSTGELVADTGAHTITVYYQSSGAWTSQVICNTQAPAAEPENVSYPAFLGSDNTGIYTITVPSTYTNCEHVILTISTATTGVIIPTQQFYPVNLDEISNKVWGRNAGTTVTENSNRTLTEETPDLCMRLNTINAGVQNCLGNAQSVVALIGENRYSHPALDIMDAMGETSVELTVTKDINNHITSIN
ncbi:MAG: hypothetical protein II444_06060 [Firmicutes bacterium]|nr:hypothetical protein [Bacillota bacterium]